MRFNARAQAGTLSVLLASLLTGLPHASYALPADHTATLDSLSLEFREALAAERYAKASMVLLLDVGGVKLETNFTLQVCDDAGSYGFLQTSQKERIFMTRGDSTWTIDPVGRKYMVTVREYAEPADLETDDFQGLFSPPFSVRTLTPLIAPAFDEELEHADMDTIPLNGESVVCERWISPDRTEETEDPEKIAWARVWRDERTGAILRSWFKPEPLLPMTMRIDVTELDLGTACGEDDLPNHDLAGYTRISSFGSFHARKDLVGSPAPILDVASLDGEATDPRPWDQGPVLLGFWATWCAPCRKELDQLATLVERHEGALRAVMVSKETEPTQTAFLGQRSLPFDFRRDAGAGIHEAYDVGHIPALYIIDGEGIIRGQIVGLQPLEELETLLREIRILAP